MATFANWLAGHETGAETDPVAWLARQWKALEGNRPRVSSPSGIEKHLLTLAPDGPAEGDAWTGYVHQAVAEATQRYRQDKAGEQAAGNAGETQETMPGMNAATGKPAAVVPSSQWVQHPDASQFGTCDQEGWARGLAMIGGKTVITCAAAHIFEPARPDEVIGTATSSGPAGGEATARLADADQLAAVESGQMTPAGHLAANQAAADAADDGEDAPGWAEVLGIKLDAILVSLGLPIDPYELSALLAGAIGAEANAPDADGSPLLSAQLRAAAGEMAAIPPEPGSQASGQPLPSWGRHTHAGDGTVEGCPGCFPRLAVTWPDGEQGMPPSFAAWYGMADPEATPE